MTIFITGITGLIGSHLAEFLLEETPHNVVGLVRVRGNIQNLDHLAHFAPTSLKLRGASRAAAARLRVVEGSVDDGKAIDDVIRKTKPDILFHLAAQSYPHESWSAPISTFHTNVDSTIHILETVKTVNPKMKVLVACSAAEYGLVHHERSLLPKEGETLTRQDYPPLTENTPLHPLHPYGISKVAQEMLGYEYFVNFGIPVYLPRFFIQAGPRQGDRISVQTFAKQIAEKEISLGKKRGGAEWAPLRSGGASEGQGSLANRSPKGEGGSDGGDEVTGPHTIRVGNLNAYRDYLDVRDGVRAIWAIVEKGKPGTPYNVCSGTAYKVQYILDSLIKMASVPIRVEVDPKRLRPSDEPVILGSHEKLTAATGWTPKIPIEETLRSILNYWRHALSA
ncbi:MAG: GDP-mannose 4,6-dehydratase [bacterium]|nr:GDP-mannose 4,6-dehydratase [bacterium]